MNYKILYLFVIALSSLLNSIEAKEKQSIVSEYESVKIGNQVWMKKNLDVDHYRNGDSITELRNPEDWEKSSNGAWCNYNNDPSYGEIYGKLYNWFAVDDSRGLAPEGWHIPSDAEWKTLELYLGMTQIEADGIDWRGTNQGSKLKELGIINWDNQDSNASIDSAFAAILGGWRYTNGKFNRVGLNCLFWTSSGGCSYQAWFRNLSYSNSNIYRKDSNIFSGLSVRCVKDN